MNPRFVTFCGLCFRKSIPELMEPNVEGGFTVIIPFPVREKSLPAGQMLADDRIISAKKILHVSTDINDTGFPAFGFPDENPSGYRIYIINTQ